MKCNGQLASDEDELQSGVVYSLEPRLCGGKGGLLFILLLSDWILRLKSCCCAIVCTDSRSAQILADLLLCV